MKPSITFLFVLIRAVFSPTMVRSQAVFHSLPLHKSWFLKAHKQPAQANVATIVVRAGQEVSVQLSASHQRPSLLGYLALSAAVMTSQLGKTHEPTDPADYPKSQNRTLARLPTARGARGLCPIAIGE